MQEPSVKSLKSFGLLMGGVFFLITLVLVYKDLQTAPFFSAAIALGFIVTAVAAPGKLQGIHERWMKVADVIGRFNAKLIIGFVYLIFFSLVHLIFWIIRKDPMNRKFDPAATSYWQEHEALNASDPKRYEKQY